MTVPAVGVVPPIAWYVTDVELFIAETTNDVGEPPYRVPVPAVAVMIDPTARLAVVVIPVIVAVHGDAFVPAPEIEPTVPVELTTYVGAAAVCDVHILTTPIGMIL